MNTSNADIRISVELVTEKIAMQLENLKQKINASINKANDKPFQSWALSLMFAGMALQRLASAVYTFGVKAYDEVSHSIIGTITASDRLNGSMMYLGYTIGSALQPILEVIIPIIETISNWVADNQTLTAGIIVLAGVIGGAAGLYGMLVLANSGLMRFLGTLQTTDWAGIGSTIQKGIGVVSIAYGFIAAKDAYDDFANGNVMAGIKDALSAAALTAGGFLMMSNPVVGGALIAIGLTFKFVSDKFFTQMVTVMKVMLDLVLILGAAITDAILSPWIAVYNTIVAAHNLLSKNDWKKMDQYSLSGKAYDKMMKDAISYGTIDNNGNYASQSNNNSVTNNYYAPVTIGGTSTKNTTADTIFGVEAYKN